MSTITRETRQSTDGCFPDPRLVVLHAQKDLYIQFEYGMGLVNAVNATSSEPIAEVVTYGNAGHGYLTQGLVDFGDCS